MLDELKIDSQIKDEFPDIKFDELEKYGAYYDERYCRRLVSQEMRPQRLLGHNGMNFLLNSLQRSRCLFTGFVNSINQTHKVISYLAVRAHFETTGSTAYFLQYLERFYNKEISYEEVDKILFKLALGGKVFPDKDTIPERVDPVNVLTQIDAADKYYKKDGGEHKIFRECYDFLSEFCHPNLLGLTIASHFESSGTIAYSNNPKFTKADFGTLSSYMKISCEYFFYLHGSCFELLKNNEETPTLIK